MQNTIASRLEPQRRGSRLRILIVGAGIAGSTLGALLRQRGVSPALIERGSKEEDGGYMIGLLPLGGRVLNGLGLSDAYEARSLAINTYAMYDRNGQLIRTYPLAPLIQKFGSWRGIERGSLLTMLREVAGPICFDTTVTGITEGEATFQDGSKAEFDVIIGADGIHSSTRKLVVPPEEIEHFDTGWGGFVLWSRPESYREDAFSELWSAGWGVGLYPVPGRVGIFLAGRHAELRTTDATPPRSKAGCRPGYSSKRYKHEIERPSIFIRRWQTAGRKSGHAAARSCLVMLLQPSCQQRASVPLRPWTPPPPLPMNCPVQIRTIWTTRLNFMKAPA